MINKDTRILVIVHLFYMESIDEIIKYLRNLKYYKYDLLVTITERMYREDALEKLKKFKTDVEIRKYQNKGFDIGPFIDVLKDIKLDKYDIVIKLHTKGINKEVFAYGQFFRGRDWFLNLFDGVLGVFSVHNTIKMLGRKSRYGLVAAKNLIVSDPPHKRELVVEGIEEKMIKNKNKSKIFKKIYPPKNYKFVAGSCFAIKAECLKPIQNLGLSIKDFENVERGTFSFGHVMERAICYVVENLGYEYYGNSVDFWRNLKYGKVEKKLKELSTLNLYKDDRFEIDKMAAIRYIEMAYMSGYRIRDIRIDELVFPEEYLKNKRESYKKLEMELKEGYDEKRLIVIDQYKNIIDGKKRIEIMKKMNRDSEIKVLEINALPLDVRTIRRFSKKIDYFK